MYTFLLQHLLTDSASNFPDRDAVVFKDQSITYAELESQSNQLANNLMRHGVKAGERVGIMLNKSIETIIGIFGILKVGASYVPVDPAMPASRIIYILKNTDIAVLLTSLSCLKKNVEELRRSDMSLRKIIVTDGSLSATGAERNLADFISWKQVLKEERETCPMLTISDVSPAYILHTSGSTGSPKGVVISHLNALAFVNMAAEFFRVNEEDRFCNHAPINFDLSVFDIFVAMRCGAAVVLVPENLSLFPIKLAEYIEQTRITVWNSVSSVLSMLASRGKLDRFDFTSLRLFIFSGEILPIKYLRIAKKYMLNTEFYNIYGQTEANSSTYYKIADMPDSDAWKIPIGKPFPNFDVFAIDDNEKVICSPGEEGELYVKSATVALGYWRDPSKTSEKFLLDPRNPDSFNIVYRTGDLVQIGDDGNINFLGRKDHQIKSRGYRIELGEIEIVLNSIPEIKHAAVVPLPDDLIGNRIMACVSLVEGAIIDSKDIYSHCVKILPKYMIPESVIFLSELPHTANGKIDREKLLKIVAESN